MIKILKSIDAYFAFIEILKVIDQISALDFVISTP